MLDDTIENTPIDENENSNAIENTQEPSTEKVEDVKEVVEVVAEEKAEVVAEEVATEAVAETTPSPKEKVTIDYASLDLESLIKEFQKLVKGDAVHTIKNDVEAIKTNFNQKFGALLSEKKKAFLEDGGNEIDFQYNNPFKSQFNELLFEFKVKREKYYKQQKDEQKENLIQRLAIIEEIKSLIDNAEASTMYKNFRGLQDKWRVIGKIPHANYNDVWRTYHHHVERFYDLLHLNNDFRDLDFKHNLDEKLKLVTRAETLVEEKDINKSFKELQILHKLWKEDIGPVAKEFRDDVWNKFSDATKKIHDIRHEFQKNMESKYEENVLLKERVIEEIKNFVGGDDEQIDSHSVWQQKIKELDAMRQKFFKIGKVPRAKNEQIWNAFKEVTATFNRKKNVFYKGIKKHQQENLDRKRALVAKAESLKDAEDSNVTTPIMKQIQAEWKTIGHVPRKFSDPIWKQFQDACNHYFNKLHTVQDEANKGEIEVYNKKKDMLDGLKSQVETNDVLSLEVIQSYINDWKDLGLVPFNMRHIESKFNKVIDKLFDKLNLDKNEIIMLRFKNTINSYIAQKQFRKIDDEQLFVRRKLDEIKREVQQLENNISFISNAKDDNPLIINVRKNIENHNKQLIIWKTKLGYLTSLEY